MSYEKRLGGNNADTSLARWCAAFFGFGSLDVSRHLGVTQRHKKEEGGF
jgi:hypothetical protein